MDAIAVTSAGQGRYVGVAPCGTAFTAEQLGELVRASDLRSTGVLTAFDADAAGQKAALRAYDLLSGVTARPMTVTLAAGQDPASVFAEHGPESLRLALDHLARPLADLVIDARLEKYTLDGIDAQFNALGSVAPIIARMPAMEWPRQAFRVSAKIGLTPAEVTDAVIAAMPSDGDGDGTRAGPVSGHAAGVAAKDLASSSAAERVSPLPVGVPASTARSAATPGQARRSTQ